MLGFTGGEPFLYPEFLVAVTRRAGELGFRFDKLMTNGVWHRDAGHLRAVLTRTARCGLHAARSACSVDKFHGMDIAEARRVLPRDARRSSTATTSCR